MFPFGKIVKERDKSKRYLFSYCDVFHKNLYAKMQHGELHRSVFYSEI